MENNSDLKKTFKSSDTEEKLDVYFYRPFGYIMALAAKKLKITPNAVTYFSFVVGMAAGHMFYYEDLFLNVIGILLLIWAEALDSTDGQLARMTNTRSRLGRILDGLGGNLWFLSIYIHVCLRLIIFHDYSPFIFGIALAAGLSHSFQSAYADYFRNMYLYFVSGSKSSELDSSKKLKEDYGKIKWSDGVIKKLLMRVYLNYTMEQEMLSTKTRALYNAAKDKYSDKIDEQFVQKYRSLFKPMVKYFNALTTNTRMIILFIAILSGYYMFYFYFELTVLNLLLIYTIRKHERQSEDLLNMLKSA